MDEAIASMFFARLSAGAESMALKDDNDLSSAKTSFKTLKYYALIITLKSWTTHNMSQIEIQ